MNKEGKKRKDTKDREEGGEVEKWWDKGGLPLAHTVPPIRGDNLTFTPAN